MFSPRTPNSAHRCVVYGTDEPHVRRLTQQLEALRCSPFRSAAASAYRATVLKVLQGQLFADRAPRIAAARQLLCVILMDDRFTGIRTRKKSALHGVERLMLPRRHSQRRHSPRMRLAVFPHIPLEPYLRIFLQPTPQLRDLAPRPPR